MSNKKKIIIFGLGSSALRFAELLLDKYEVYFYTHRPGLKAPEYAQLSQRDPFPEGKPRLGTYSLNSLSNYYAAIISSPTSTHLKYLKACIQANLPVLVDKPLSDKLTGLKPLLKKAKQQNQLIVVGLNLRFLPIIQHLKHLLSIKALGQIYHAEFYAGQYLPSWRPNKDYAKTYSANYHQGGGVALDLIHEIDLAYHFFPNIKLQPVFSHKVSNLKIDVEDLAIFQTRTKPFVQVKLDYLNQQLTRKYLIIGEKGTINCDIINQRFSLTKQDGQVTKITAKKYFDTKKTYQTELSEFFAQIKLKQQPDLSDRALALDALQVAIKARKHVPKL